MVLLVWNHRPKFFLQPIANPSKILSIRRFTYVSVATKPTLVYVVEALNQEYCFSAIKSLSGNLYLPPSLTPTFRSPWSRFPLRSFSMKDGSLHVPYTKLSSPLHTKPEGRWFAGEPLKLQAPRYKLELHSSTSHKAQHLALTLSQELI